MMESSVGGGEDVSEWEASVFNIRCLKPCNWWKSEFNKWTHLVAQGHGIENFENDNISKGWLTRGIPHRKLITSLQLRANICPTREFLARGRPEGCVRACRHCSTDYETT